MKNSKSNGFATAPLVIIGIIIIVAVAGYFGFVRKHGSIAYPPSQTNKACPLIAPSCHQSKEQCLKGTHELEKKYPGCTYSQLCENEECFSSSSSPQPLVDTSNWKTYSWGNFKFKYPPAWVIEKEYYTTPPGYTSIVALNIKPLSGKNKEDVIIIGGRQFDCSIAIGLCKTVAAMAIHTTSSNLEITNVFDLLVDSAIKLNHQ